MNHQTAKIVAESYRQQVQHRHEPNMDPWEKAQWGSLCDHSAVWHRVADTLKQEAQDEQKH